MTNNSEQFSFNFSLHVFERSVAAAIFFIVFMVVGEGLLVFDLNSTGEKELVGWFIDAVAVAGALLLVVAIPMWIHKQETVVVTGTSIRSSVFGFIRFKEIASYQVHPLAYPPRIKLKLRDGRTIRFALRPKPMTFGHYDESEYVAFANTLLDKLERAAASNVSSTKPVEEKPLLGPEVTKGVIGVLVAFVIVGMIAFPSRMIIASPILAAAGAAVFGHESWRKRRIQSQKNLTTRK